MINTFLCGLLPFIFCAVPHVQTQPVVHLPAPGSANNISVITEAVSSATSTEVTVKTGYGATSTTYRINAPYGVKSEVIDENGRTYATTTPLTQTDVEQMQKQAEQEQADIKKQIDQMLQEQQKLFDDIRLNL